MSRQASQPIRPDIEKILHRAFPRGVMAPALDVQTTHLAEVFPRLKARLLELDGASIDYERDPLGGIGWDAGDGRLPRNPSKGPGPEEHPSSYYLFFLSATAAPCQVDGDVKVGYSVALSIMAPMALVVLNHFEEDDYAGTVPEITPEEIEDENGESVEIGRFCRERLSGEGHAELARLRDAIVAVIGEFGFQDLPEEEETKPIPWLEVPPMPFRSPPQRLTVREALFFWAL